MSDLKISDDMQQQCLDAFFCPITKEIMINPVILIADGHTYEETAIKQWFSTGRRISPMTGARVISTNTKANYTIRKAINEYLMKYPEHKKQLMDQKTLLKIIELKENDLKAMIAKTANNIQNNDNNNNNINTDLDPEVIQFLTKLNMIKYIPIFIENECISMNTLYILTEDDLKEMIKAVGPRRKILNALNQSVVNVDDNINDQKQNLNDDNNVIQSKKNVSKNIDPIKMKNNDMNQMVECVVCKQLLDKNHIRIIDNLSCCDDCYNWCSNPKHNQRCLQNKGELSFGTQSWYCYKCMIVCTNCGVWWRPNQLNFNQKGSGIVVKCSSCSHNVNM